MVIIETYEWENFEAPTLKEAKRKMVECLALHDVTDCNVANIIVDDVALCKNTITQISYEIENEIQEWLVVAIIESEGLRRAQQESMEG